LNLFDRNAALRETAPTGDTDLVSNTLPASRTNPSRFRRAGHLEDALTELSVTFIG
jgi:hypothetical protein